MSRHIIQQKWEEGYLPGIDAIYKGDDNVVMANAYSLTDGENKREYYWFPVCDTTIESMLKYENDIWVPVDVYSGAIPYNDGMIVFGDGAMGNEGFVALVNAENELNWAFFFTFSNPIIKAEIKNNILICTSDNQIQVQIQLNELTKVKVFNTF